MRFSFANRERETRDLRAFLNAPLGPRAAQVCLVRGKSGVGKSRLVDQVTQSVSDKKFVRVLIKASDYRSGESGFYLRTAALAVADCCERYRWGTSLKAFSLVRSGAAALKAGLGAIARRLEAVSLGDADASVVKAWNAQSATIKELLGEPFTPASRLAAAYLNHALSAEPVILAIENAQSIDAESLQYLSQIANEQQSLRIVYEFTPQPYLTASDTGRVSYEQLVAAHSASERTLSEIEVDQIAFDELARVNFQNLDGRFVEVLRRELSDKAGNVRALERLHEITETSSTTDTREFQGPRSLNTETAFRSLSSEHKLVLWIVALSRRDLDPYELSTIVGFMPPALRPQSPSETLKGLSPFVVERSGVFCMDHDSLLPFLEASDPTSRERLVAADALGQYLQDFLAREDFSQLGQNEILFGLLWLSGPLSSSALVDLAVVRLEKHAKASGRPAGLLRLVKDFSSNAQRNPLHNQTVSRLVRIVYDACWIEGALDLTEHHRNASPEIWLCHCHALGLKGHPVQAEAELQELRKRFDELDGPGAVGGRLSNFIGLTGVLLARVRGDYAEAKRRYLNLREKFFSLAEDRALYLRFSEIAGVDGVADRLQRGLELARSLSDKSHFVRTALALAMVKAEGGETAEALSLLDQAKDMADLSYVDGYMVATNRLATEALSGTPSDTTVEAVYNCLPSVLDSMDRILVLNNLLAASAIKGDVASASRYQALLETYIERIVEPNMRRITCFNLSIYYGIQRLEALSQQFRQKAFEVAVDFDNDYWRARRVGSVPPSTDFRLRRPFDLPMMSNWYFTLPDFATTLG